MNRIQIGLICLALAGCQRATVETRADVSSLDLNAHLSQAKAKLASLLPEHMTVSRAELFELDQGIGIILSASPEDANKTQPGFVLFLWPATNSMDIAYETGAGAHTFRPIGNSEDFRIYYSDPSGFMKKEVVQAFCTKKKE